MSIYNSTKNVDYFTKLIINHKPKINHKPVKVTQFEKQ